MFCKVSAIFLVGLVAVKGIVDFRFAKEVDPPGSNICEKPLFNGYTCKNCTELMHCKNSTSNATVIGTCPNNRICLDGRCVTGIKCPFPDVLFFCTTPGVFPDPGNCTKYYICATIKNILERIEVKCEGNENGLKYGFNPEKLACSDVLPNNGQCQNNYVPICKNLFEMGVIPRTSIYYECRYYVKENGDLDQNLLYPFQSRCPNGKIYNLVAGECR